MPGSKVAVVNDDTQFLHMMELILSDAGYEVLLLVESGPAYDRIREWLPDVVVLDIRIESPEAGWTILDLMKLDRATESIPVLVCSAAHEDLILKEEHLARHNCKPLFKPFAIDDLLDLVNETIGPGA